MVGLKSLKMDHIYIYIYSEPLPIGNKVWVTTVFLLVTTGYHKFLLQKLTTTSQSMITIVVLGYLTFQSH